MSNKAATIIRKITLKNIDAQPQRNSVTERTRLATLIGVITKVVDKPSVYGISTEFTGQFRALNVVTGEVFESNKMFCPSMLEDMINGAFRGEALEFAVAIEVQPAPSSATGYEYLAVPLIETQSDNALDRLQSLLPALEKEAPADAEAKKEKADAEVKKGKGS